MTGLKHFGLILCLGLSGSVLTAQETQQIHPYFRTAHVDSFKFEEKKVTELTLLGVKRIWDQAPHNAFTDLIYAKDNWYCVFRESSGHVGGDGAGPARWQIPTTGFGGWYGMRIRRMVLVMPVVKKKD